MSRSYGRPLGALALVFASSVALAQTAICYNCPPEWADWGSQLRAIKDRTGGVDVYFDNVGGMTTDAVIPAIKRRARVVICGAISQYDSWIDAKAALAADAAKMGPSFKPLYIGMHWPSEPWGDEELKTGGTSFDIGTVPAPARRRAFHRADRHGGN